MRVLLGLALTLTGLFIIFAEILWTSSESRDLPLLSDVATAGLMFLLGLTGMILCYAGLRLLRTPAGRIGNLRRSKASNREV